MSLASNLATTLFLLVRDLASDSFFTTLRFRYPYWTHAPEPELRFSNSPTAPIRIDTPWNSMPNAHGWRRTQCYDKLEKAIVECLK